MPVRRILIGMLLVFAGFCTGFAQPHQQDAGAPLITFLNQSIDWYHRVQSPGQLATETGDSIYSSYNQDASLQAITLIFEFARAQAVLTQMEHPQGGDGAESAPSSHLSQTLARVQQRVQQTTSSLTALEQQAQTASGSKRQMLDNQIAEQKSELELSEARLEALRSVSAFASAGTSAGLLGEINELERMVPEVRTVVRSAHPARNERNAASTAQSGSAAASTSETAPSEHPGDAGSAQPATSAAPSIHEATHEESTSAAPLPQAATATPAAKQPASGILGLTSELFALTSQMNAQRNAITATTQLRSSLDKIRDPLTRQLRAINAQGDQLASAAPSSDPKEMAARKQQADALTVEFRKLSGVMLPLAKASMLLDSTNNNLAEWRSRTERNYTTVGRGLLLRVSVLAIALVLVGIASDFWRRAIFRYIREQRRRNQIMLLRRIVMGLAIALILIFGLSTEIGSLATFAGFLTAGIAVALQNIILSVAAYFLLIGRHGIKVGDRIQIGEVTGDVVDIGLVRLQLVELDTSGSEARPTGRSVVFSNSVVFQPTSNFFKQLPESNFAWRKISLTLATDVDYALAQKSISGTVDGVYKSYKAELDRQHRELERSLAIHLGSTDPQTRLRLMEGGLEIVILYPVLLTEATAIDDRMTHALLTAIESEPRLRLVGAGLTAIKPVDATPHATPVAPVQSAK
jgi:small-conductance mechanosensitive channel